MKEPVATNSKAGRNARRHRPAWLRALGHGDPPPEVEARGQRWQRVHIYKHDAFAATALYAAVAESAAGDTADKNNHHGDDHSNRNNRNGDHNSDHGCGVADRAGGDRLVVKFSRQSPVLGIPLSWLGRHLRRKEQRFYRRLAEIAGVPDDAGDIAVHGTLHPTAAGHDYVPGHPLHHDDRPGDAFFPELERLLAAVHACNIAVVDFNKTENIIVDQDGRPHLIDFQISAMPGGRFPFYGWLARRWVALLQRSDRYHLAKHWLRQRPDQLADHPPDLDALRPLGVKLMRWFWRPVILARRRMLVWLGIRTGKGTADTERSAAATASVFPGAAAPPDAAVNTATSSTVHATPHRSAASPAPRPEPALLAPTGELT